MSLLNGLTSFQREKAGFLKRLLDALTLPGVVVQDIYSSASHVC